MTSLTLIDYRMPGADLGPLNPLPPIGPGGDVHAKVRLGPGIPPEDSRYIGYGGVRSPLPYLSQDGYGRELRERTFRALVLENEHLRATFLPELGGRLWSLVALPEERELLFRNPVFQPANLAIRNAWFAGGVEWNIGLVGHTPLTCSPLFASRLDAPDGTPLVRIYEWERLRGVYYQVDAWLPADSRVLLVGVRIVNPNDGEVPMYWWSNIAVAETAGTRVVVPADEAYTFAYGGEMLRVPMPVWEGLDRTYPVRGPRATDYFFRLSASSRPWIAALEDDGRGLFQTSTDRLRGRKLFLWGNGAGGRHWQSFLSRPGLAYIEIQAGLARTQFEHIPMPARAAWSWMEAYGEILAPPEVTRTTVWPDAKRLVEDRIERSIPRTELERRHRALEEMADTPPREILHQGSGWGALEERRRRAAGDAPRAPAGLVFPDTSLGPREKVWVALLETGRLDPSGAEDALAVTAVQSGHAWRSLLEASVAGDPSPGWLAWYHLGILRSGDGETRRALDALVRSTRIRPTPWALRARAVLELERGRPGRAVRLAVRALRRAPGLVPLAVECGRMHVGLGRYGAWLRRARGLPPELYHHPRIRLLCARAQLGLGRLDEVESFLAHPPVVADMREGEVSLSELWFAFHERREAARLGRPLTPEERTRLRRGSPPPAAIDFRVDGDG